MKTQTELPKMKGDPKVSSQKVGVHCCSPPRHAQGLAYSNWHLGDREVPHHRQVARLALTQEWLVQPRPGFVARYAILVTTPAMHIPDGTCRFQSQHRKLEH